MILSAELKKPLPIPPEKAAQLSCVLLGCPARSHFILPAWWRCLVVGETVSGRPPCTGLGLAVYWIHDRDTDYRQAQLDQGEGGGDWQCTPICSQSQNKREDALNTKVIGENLDGRGFLKGFEG